VQATIYNLEGQEVEKIELSDAIFGVTPNHAVIQQAVLRQQANARQGTHDTKTRADVSGGGKKPWRQKGTGRARQGSTRSPQWRHGGVVFGPHPRSYEQDMPRKMRHLAIRGVLSGKLADGQLVLVDSFEALEPRTKAMVSALESLNIGGQKVLIFTTGEETSLKMAAGNLQHVTMQSAHMLSIVDMLKNDVVVMPRAALDVVTGILGSTGGRRKLVLKGYAAPAAGKAAEEAPAPKAATSKAQAAETEEAEAESKPAGKNPAKAEARVETNTEEKAEEEVEAKPEAKSEEMVEAKAEAKTEPAKPRSKAAAAESAEATETAETAEAEKPPKAAGRHTIKAGTVQIAKVHFEGDEYVELHNTNDFPADIVGYVLRDKRQKRQSFTFPEGAEINPGGKLTVFTAPGHKYSFESKRPIWNNEGDEAELLDASGKVVSTYSYGSYAEDEDAKKESED
jgi:large subunit ribosomal protein L4